MMFIGLAFSRFSLLASILRERSEKAGSGIDKSGSQVALDNQKMLLGNQIWNSGCPVGNCVFLIYTQGCKSGLLKKSETLFHQRKYRSHILNCIKINQSEASIFFTAQKGFRLF